MVDEELDMQAFVGTDSFVLKVRGDAMIEDHLCDGDFVIVEPQKLPRQGEMVIACYDGKSTLRRYYGGTTNVILRAGNPAYLNHVVPADQVEIKGVVIGLLRSYRS
jgi:repressor LexA